MFVMYVITGFLWIATLFLTAIAIPAIIQAVRDKAYFFPIIMVLPLIGMWISGIQATLLLFQ